MTEPILRRISQCLLRGCLAVGSTLLLGYPNVYAQTTDNTTTAVFPLSNSAPNDIRANTADTASLNGKTSATPSSSAWQRLSKRQKQALAPLASTWDTLTVAQQQKWLTISRGFLQLSDEEQITLHARMKDWASLSPKQRHQARFNFNSTQSLPIEDKRAQWEAYQQLSEQDKRLLSSGPKPPVKSAARSTQPPSKRLISPPAMPTSGQRAIQRISLAQPIHPKTLLPLPNRPAEPPADRSTQGARQ